MDFKDTYQRTTPWWRIVTASFIMIDSFTVQTSILGHDIDCEEGRLAPDGRLTAKACFVFGASGPTIDTKSSHRGACFHDLLYLFSQKGYFEGSNSKTVKAMADNLLFFMCIEDEMWEWRAEAWYKAVSEFGDSSWEG